jgi:NADP-dependent 3-hydroxy acid dehydrogenase YdfG
VARTRQFEGKVVAVTGASSGIGRAVARAFGRQGAKVGLIARNEGALENAASEIRAAGGEALVLPLDLADAAAVDRAADEVVARFGRLDIWVNDAMVSVFSPVAQMRADEYRRVTEVNYLGTVHGTVSALRHMRARDAGTIVQVGSALAYRSIPLQSAYCGSKAAVRAFTDALRCELLHDRSRVRVTMVQLPAVNTPQFEVVRNRLDAHARPVPPVYQPETVAEGILWAARHAPRELWIGWSTMKAIVGQRVIPGLLDRYLARMAWKAQTTDRVPKPVEDNVDAPLPGDRGSRGIFGGIARRGSLELWLRLHRGALAAAIAAAAATALSRPRAMTGAGGQSARRPANITGPLRRRR